ncbi:LPD7 domain-containing protein [Paraburkholderia xenovorans]
MNQDDLATARLDWVDPHALGVLKRRRQQDLAAAREGLQASGWAASSQAFATGVRDLPPGEGDGTQAAAPVGTRQTETDQTQAPPGDARRPAPASMTGPLATPPDSVSKRFLQAGPRYFLRDGSREMAFEDRGVRMVTAHNRPDIAESMAEMALAKGWTHIHVKGHEDFRRAVWLEAAVRGIGVTGYAPNGHDRASLAELMQARMTNRVEKMETPGSQAPEQTAGKEATPAAGWTGQLIRHGVAPYQHEANGARSYFVTLRDAAGADRTVWGVDLERAMQASGVQPGQRVTLSNLGRQPVTINEPVRDAAGQVVGEQPKSVERNVWKVETAGPEPAPVQSRTQPPSTAIIPPTSGNRPGAAVDPQSRLRTVADLDSTGWLPESEFRGELVAHGRAPYRNRAGAQATYFVTLREANGNPLTVWGADLERALAASGAQAGEPVHLVNYGRRRVAAEVPAVDGRGDVMGTERRTIERYVWRAMVEPRDRQPAVETGRDDPQRALHMSVLAEAMRAKGFSEKSVAKVQMSASEIMDRLSAQGVVVPAPRVFDPAGRVQQPRSRGNPATPTAPEVERMLQPPTPAVPSR